MIWKRHLWAGLTYLFAFLLILSILVMSVLEQFRTTVDSYCNTQSQEIISTDDETLWSTFVPDEDYLTYSPASGEIVGANSENLLKSAIELGRKQGYEGTVLLKNVNGTLPLASGANVTLLGKRTHTSLLGSGMGVDVKGQYISLETALSGTSTNFAVENTTGHGSAIYDYSKLSNFEFRSLNLEGRSDGAGAGYHINPAMVEKYVELLKNSAYSCSDHDLAPGGTFNPKEPDSSAIAQVSLTGYTDAAIIMFSRPSSEARDYVRHGMSGEDIEAFALSAQERNIVSYATEHFSKVIVLLNTSCPMQIEELETNEKIGAILWVGQPGAYGFLGVADVLTGRVSPSGGLFDLFPTNNLSAPASVNVGHYGFTNKSSATRGGSYVIEAEGIYVGYRYYETRYNDCVLGKGNADSSAGVYASSDNSWNYGDEVLYPFGYGLSYTTFTMNFVGEPQTTFAAHAATTKMTVRVTNNGSVAGSIPVQIYGQAPYVHGTTTVEKSAIQLLAFDKTDILAPGAHQDIEFEIDWQNLASYDSTYQNEDGSVGNYILDAGDYRFAVGYNNETKEQGSHVALNNVLAAQGHSPINTGHRMDNTGNDNLVYTYHFTVPGNGTVDGDTFGYSKTNTKISNQIPYADWNYLDPNDQVTYLSRSDWQTTYPKEYVSLAIPAEMMGDFEGKYYEIATSDDVSSVKWGQDNGYLFFQLALSDYDDTRWDALLDQFTLSESILFAAYSGDNVPTTDSIGLFQQKVTENSGNGIDNGPYFNAIIKTSPWYISSEDNNANMSGKSFATSPVLASSFSPALSYETGVYIGNEALFYGLPILWGPGLNTHRNAYNGRAGEYYSEDPVLSGALAMEFAVGARSKGLVSTMKHYAFNDQETDRSGVAPFMTEQRAREIELRAFQIAIEATKYDGNGLIGLMCSFSKIGPVECTASYGLITGIAKKEWGFHGQIVTDIYDDVDIYPALVYSGCTGYDYRGAGTLTFDSLAGHNITALGEPITEEIFAGDVTLQKALKESNHNMLWALTQSNLMNLYNISTKTVWKMTWWRQAYIAAIAVSAILTAGGITMYVLSLLKGRKNRGTDEK